MYGLRRRVVQYTGVSHFKQPAVSELKVLLFKSCLHNPET